MSGGRRRRRKRISPTTFYRYKIWNIEGMSNFSEETKIRGRTKIWIKIMMPVLLYYAESQIDPRFFIRGLFHTLVLLYMLVCSLSLYFLRIYFNYYHCKLLLNILKLFSKCPKLYLFPPAFPPEQTQHYVMKFILKVNKKSKIEPNWVFFSSFFRPYLKPFPQTPWRILTTGIQKYWWFP